MFFKVVSNPNQDQSSEAPTRNRDVTSPPPPPYLFRHFVKILTVIFAERVRFFRRLLRISGRHRSVGFGYSPSQRIAWIHCLCVVCPLILCCGTAWGAEYRLFTETSLNIQDDVREGSKASGPQIGDVVISGRGELEGNSYVLRVTEGLPKSVLIKLSANPLKNVELSFSKLEIANLERVDVSVSSSTLTFTPTNWNTPQEVEVVVSENPRSLGRCNIPDQNNYPGNWSGQIDFSISSDDERYSSPTLSVFTYDNDNPACNSEDYEHDVPVGITVPSTAMVTEGSTTTVEVKLAAKPAVGVTVTFSDDGDSDVSWSGTALSDDALTFTPLNWNVAQTVTLTAGEDGDFANDAETLTLTASADGGYYGVTANIAVTVVDDDAPRIIVSPSVVSVPEGSMKTVEVKLSAEPAGPTGYVTLTFADDGDSDISWLGTVGTVGTDGNFLYFDSGNWNVAKEVTLTAAQDSDVVDDLETITLTGAGAESGYAGVKATIAVTIVDDDIEGAGITVPGTATVTEGSTATVDVKLAAEPKANVTVTFSDDGDSDVSWSGTALSGNVLTFTTSNWNAAQTVTLTAAEDDDFTDGTETLTLTASTSGGYKGETAEVSVTISDNDVGGAGITVPGTAAVTEGSTSTVEVTLTAAPKADVTVTFSDDGDSDVSWSGSALSGNALTFTTSNWSVAQEVTLTASQDDDFTDDTETVTLTASTSGATKGRRQRSP